MPIFDDAMERAHQLSILGHWSDHISYRSGERINHDCAHRSCVLPNLRRKIEERCNNAERRDQLSEGADRFRAHKQCLTKELENDDVNVVSRNGGLFMAL